MYRRKVDDSRIVHQLPQHSMNLLLAGQKLSHFCFHLSHFAPQHRDFVFVFFAFRCARPIVGQAADASAMGFSIPMLLQLQDGRL